jgi:hypothetical protein
VGHGGGGEPAALIRLGNGASGGLDTVLDIGFDIGFDTGLDRGPDHALSG